MLIEGRLIFHSTRQPRVRRRDKSQIPQEEKLIQAAMPHQSEVNPEPKVPDKTSSSRQIFQAHSNDAHALSTPLLELKLVV